MSKCLIVTCKKCKGIVALEKCDSVVFVATKFEAEGTEKLKFERTDIAIVNRMPVCECSEALRKAVEA